MWRSKWPLVLLISVAVLGASPAWAAGKGKGQGTGNQAGGAQGQWVNNQPPGWSGHGQKQGWARQGAAMPGGLDKNLNRTGKYPKGLQKTR